MGLSRLWQQPGKFDPQIRIEIVRSTWLNQGIYGKLYPEPRRGVRSPP
jgi:hypothetical protein